MSRGYVAFFCVYSSPQFVVPSWLAADGATSEKVTHSFIDGFTIGGANYTFIKIQQPKHVDALITHYCF